MMLSFRESLTIDQMDHLDRQPSHGTPNDLPNASPRSVGSSRKHARDGGVRVKKTPRRLACQACRARKVKCDSSRPSCGYCSSIGSNCTHPDASARKGRLDCVSPLIAGQLNQILEGIDSIKAAIHPQAVNIEDYFSKAAHTSLNYSGYVSAASSSSYGDVIYETSRDYQRIPTSKTTADSVLTWPIFQGRYPPNYLVDILLECNTTHLDPHKTGNNTFSVSSGLEPLPDERIPFLIDKFLENVHTRNPILDVEALVRYGRRAASTGLGLDAESCLVLLACALGSIVISFGRSEVTELEKHAPGINSSIFFVKEIHQAESCYVLACRRLGLLNQTILGAQCYFYSAVYLMHTLRPLQAWNHFCQASTFYQIHSRTIGRPAFGVTLESYLNEMTLTQRRLEQSLYWSCFKSECEMRVELPLPQSTIADMDYPHMFPNPPFHASDGLGLRSYNSDITSFGWESEVASNNVINDETSWYYYLTEVALRRIGNQILNTFYHQEHTSWLDITSLIPNAKEFEEQILVWSSNLPLAMRYDKQATSNSARELGWATYNRLLEIKSWLYQPFLYYAIHCNEAQAVELSENIFLQSLILGAMEVNIRTVEMRSLRHRHHGTWFDLRSIVTASFEVIAAAQSGRVKVEPEWEDRIRLVIATLAFWEDESADLRKTRQTLEDLLVETRAILRRGR